MPEDVWLLPPVLREGSVGGRRRAARDRRLPQEVPDVALHEEGGRDPPRGAQAARRPRGLRGALLSEDRSPQGGGDAPGRRDPPLPGVWARARAAVLARRDLPADVRSPAREGYVRARRQRARRRAAGPPRRAVPRLHRQALRIRTALQDAADGDAGPRRRRPPRRVPMADAERPGLRELVARGRDALPGRRVRRGHGLLHRGAAREGPLRRRLRHAGRHLSPGGAPGGGRSRCSTKRCASTPRTPRRR